MTRIPRAPFISLYTRRYVLPSITMPPKRASTAGRGLPTNTLILDNGGHTIKAGFATPVPSTDDCHIIPNCIARSRDRHLWTGSELDKCQDFGEMAFRRPVEKGFVVNWESERAIWEHEFEAGKLKVCWLTSSATENIYMVYVDDMSPVRSS